MIKQIVALIFLLICVNVLCASDEERGLGGTGKWTDSGEDDRGFGGTGVIGTITDFGSIWINGMEIEFNDDTQVKEDGVSVTTSALQLGQQVQVLAMKKHASWYAKTILINHALIGKIKMDSDQNIRIQGVRIYKDPNLPGQWPELKEGNFVKVSGYYNHDQFFATNIATTGNDNTWQITAKVTLASNGKWLLGNLPLPDEVLEATEGESLTLGGIYTDKGSTVNYILHNTAIPFYGQVINYIVEQRSPEYSRSIRLSPDVFKLKNSTSESHFFKRSKTPLSTQSDFHSGQFKTHVMPTWTQTKNSVSTPSRNIASPHSLQRGHR